MQNHPLTSKPYDQAIKATPNTIEVSILMILIYYITFLVRSMKGQRHTKMQINKKQNTSIERERETQHNDRQRLTEQKEPND